jgi:hypothetical protein
MAVLLAAVQQSRNNHDVQQVVRLLDLMYEEAKDALVACGMDMFEAAQSKAQTIAHIRNKLSQPSMAEAQAIYRKHNPIQGE